jgi:hypothetical protein
MDKLTQKEQEELDQLTRRYRNREHMHSSQQDRMSELEDRHWQYLNSVQVGYGE